MQKKEREIENKRNPKNLFPNELKISYFTKILES